MFIVLILRLFCCVYWFVYEQVWGVCCLLRLVGLWMFIIVVLHVLVVLLLLFTFLTWLFCCTWLLPNFVSYVYASLFWVFTGMIVGGLLTFLLLIVRVFLWVLSFCCVLVGFVCLWVCVSLFDCAFAFDFKFRLFAGYVLCCFGFGWFLWCCF